MMRSFSRRRFLTGAAAAAAAPSFLPAAVKSGAGAERRGIAYVGTNTGKPGDWGDGEGIYAFDVDAETGALSRRRLVAGGCNSPWLAVHASGRFLYAVDAVLEGSPPSGAILAFSIDPDTGGLRRLNRVSSYGIGPAYLSMDRSGRFLLVANYGGGSIAVLPIGEDGSLGDASFTRQDTGSIGSIRAANAPPGSFAWSGHDAPHAHMILADPQNRFVLQTDLGQDRIYVDRFDPARGTLKPAESAPFVSLPAGDGPRHFAFHPNGLRLYSLQEEASTIVFFHYDPENGALRQQQTASMLPKGFTGTSFASEVRISNDGRFLYAANRLHDSLSIFAIDDDGKLAWRAETSTLGDYPSQFDLDPGGDFLYSCNQRSDAVTCFRIDRATGLLTFTGQYAPVGTPGCIVFLRRGVRGRPISPRNPHESRVFIDSAALHLVSLECST